MPVISALTELTTADDADQLAIVDTSESETKRISAGNLLANAPVGTQLVGDSSTLAASTGFVSANRVPDVEIAGPAQTTAGTLALDTTLRNVGGFASLSSNTITLAAGDYRIEAVAMMRTIGVLGSSANASVAVRRTSGTPENLAAQGYRVFSSTSSGAFASVQISLYATFAGSTDIVLDFRRDDTLFQVVNDVASAHSSASSYAVRVMVWRL